MTLVHIYQLTSEVNGNKIGTELEQDPGCSCFYREYNTQKPYFYINSNHLTYIGARKVVKHKERDMLLPTDTQDSKGIKDDSGKTQWWYMDNFWPDLEQVADVLTYGDSNKYPAEDGANWKRLENAERRFNDALLRHVLKYRYESKDDPETGKSHLAHAITNALMLMYFDRNKKGN